MQKERKRLLPILLLAVFASLLFFSCSSGGGAVEADRIVSVLANKDNEITVKAELTDETVASVGENGRVYLFALLPGQSVSGIGEMTPVAEKRASASLSFTIDRDETSTPLLYAKFVLAAVNGGNYTVISPAAYVENPQVFAAHSHASSPRSKKGLGGVDASEAEDMLVSQTIIDIPVDEALDCRHGGESCGIGVDTYKVCGERTALIDHQVRTFCDAGVTVHLRFIIKSDSSADRALPLAAVTNFFCDRYSEQVGDVILAFDLGSPVCDIHTTAALFRAFNTAAYSANSGVKTYFSVSCIFNPSEGGGSHALLEELFTALSYNGAMPFGIALDMSAARLLETRVWNDPVATADLSSHYITVRNLEIFADFLHGEEFLYNGKERDILVTDFSVRSDDNGGEDVQAAAIAYGYYKAVSVGSVTGIIYDSCFGDDGISLRTATDKKQAYNVFAALDTAKADSATDFALSLIGVNRWAAVIGSFTIPEPCYTKSYLDIKYVSDIGKFKEKPLFDFSDGSSYGFYPSDGAKSLEMKEQDGGFELYSVLAPDKLRYSGISGAVPAGSLSRARTLVLDLSVVCGNEKTDVPVRVIISGERDGKKFLYSADGSILNGGNALVEIDISALGVNREQIDRIRVLCDTAGEETTLSLRSVSYRYKPVSALLVVFIVVLSLGALFGLFVLVLYIRMLWHRKMRAIKRKKMLEARRLAAMQRKPPVQLKNKTK